MVVAQRLHRRRARRGDLLGCQRTRHAVDERAAVCCSSCISEEIGERLTAPSVRSIDRLSYWSRRLRILSAAEGGRIGDADRPHGGASLKRRSRRAATGARAYVFRVQRRAVPVRRALYCIDRDQQVVDFNERDERAVYDPAACRADGRRLELIVRRRVAEQRRNELTRKEETARAFSSELRAARLLLKTSSPDLFAARIAEEAVPRRQRLA